MKMLNVASLFRLVFCTSVFLAATASAGTYWVATNGVDATGRGSEAEPFETIQYAIDSAEIDSTIWVKPGVYDKGGAINKLSGGGVHTNRVVLGKLIHLKSTEGASVTHIVGAPDPMTGGVGAGAIRCMVSTNENSKGSTIAGFTLRNGYGDDGTSGHNHRSGGFLQFDGNRWIYFQDCVFRDCLADSFGGVRGGTYARCLFTGNRVSSTHDGSHPSCAGYANLVNCVIVGNGNNDNDITLDSNSVAINCTVVCNRGYGASQYATLHNTIVCGNTTVDYIGSKAYNSVIGGYPVVAPLDRDLRIVSGGAADGTGDPAYLASSIPFTVVTGMTDTDFAGNAISTSGASVHAGAVQATAPVAGGILWLYGPLSCNGAYVADGVPTYAQSTNGLSQWRVDFAGSKAEGATTNYLRSVSHTSPAGNATLFPDLNDSLVMMVPPKAGLITTNTPQYSKAKWVNPDTGNNTSNDGSETRPYKTIQKAVDDGGRGTVVFLAPGLYNEGGMQSESATVAPYGSYRVWATNNNVRIVGKAGAGQTVISGAPDPISGGLGEVAVKCVGASGTGVVVQGVTISNGWTFATTSQSGRGAAIRDITLTDSVVTDCHGCDSVSYQADLYRCMIYGNEALSNSLFATVNYSRPVSVVSSYIGPNVSRSSYFYGYIGSDTEAWFSTLVVTNGQSAFSQNAKIYNCIATGGKYVRTAMTSKGNLFWNFSDVEAAAVGTFTNEKPRLRKDGMHVSSTSPALTAGVAPSSAGYDSGDPISTMWHTYSTADVEGNLIRFNSDGTAMVGAAQEPHWVRTSMTISFR